MRGLVRHLLRHLLRRLGPAAAAGGALAAALIGPAGAIVIRDDVPDASYLAFGAGFDAVAAIAEGQSYGPAGLSGGNPFGTGVLVQSAVPGEHKLLTAAHALGGPDGIGAQTTVLWGDHLDDDALTPGDFATAATVATILTANVAFHPLYPAGAGPGFAPHWQYDIAVLTFTDAELEGLALPDPLAVSLAEPHGLDGAVVGYGQSRRVSQPLAAQTQDGRRRAGTNEIEGEDLAVEGVGDAFTLLEIDMDVVPFDAARQLHGGAAPTSLEATVAAFDSGAPLLVPTGPDAWAVVGLLAGGDQQSLGVFASVADPATAAFLRGQGVALSGAVPLPPAGVLLLAGLGALGCLRAGRQSPSGTSASAR